MASPLLAVEIITEHDQDFQMFIDGQQGQIIIITVVVEGATGQHLRSKCKLAFHSRTFRARDTGALERESKTAGPGQGSTSGEQARDPQPQAEQLKYESGRRVYSLARHLGVCSCPHILSQNRPE